MMFLFNDETTQHLNVCAAKWKPVYIFFLSWIGPSLRRSTKTPARSGSGRCTAWSKSTTSSPASPRPSSSWRTSGSFLRGSGSSPAGGTGRIVSEALSLSPPHSFSLSIFLSFSLSLFLSLLPFSSSLFLASLSLCCLASLQIRVEII